MGQKVHPTGFRLGITTQHTSMWYAEKSQYTENLLKDIEVREHLTKKLAHASVSRIETVSYTHLTLPTTVIV